MCNVQVQTLTICCTLNCDNASRWTICVLGFGLVTREEFYSAQYLCLQWDLTNILEICLFCTLSMPTVRLTKTLGDLSVLHYVHAYCETHQTSWRSVCSVHCPCLLWDSTDILEICLFCTLSMPTGRLTKHLPLLPTQWQIFHFLLPTAGQKAIRQKRYAIYSVTAKVTSIAFHFWLRIESNSKFPLS